MEHNAKKPRTYEHGAYFKSQYLFTKLLDLIETLPVERLGNEGVYFQSENNENNIVNIRKTVTCQLKLPKISNIFSPHKSKEIQYTSPQKLKTKIKLKKEKIISLEHSLKLSKGKKIIFINSNSTCNPIKLVKSNNNYPKTERSNYEEKKVSSSQKTLLNVIQLLQRGKNKYLPSDFVL